MVTPEGFGRRTLDSILNKPENEEFKKRVEAMKGGYQMRDGGSEHYDDRDIDALCEEGEKFAIRPQELRRYITE